MSRILWSQSNIQHGSVDGNYDARFSSNFFDLHRMTPNVKLYFAGEFDSFGLPNIELFKVKTLNRGIDILGSKILYHIGYVSREDECRLLGIESFKLTRPAKRQSIVGVELELAIDFGINPLYLQTRYTENDNNLVGMI